MTKEICILFPTLTKPFSQNAYSDTNVYLAITDCICYDTELPTK